MNNRYNEIINLPHHVSKTRPQMPMSDRAAQFAPFAALTGYDSAIKETGRLTDEKIEMDEEALNILNMKFQILVDSLDDEPEVTFTTSNQMNEKPVELIGRCHLHLTVFSHRVLPIFSPTDFFLPKT